MTTAGNGTRRCDVCGCPPHEWLSVATVATHLGISPSTVRRRCLDGTLRARDRGGRWEVPHYGTGGVDAMVLASRSRTPAEREDRRLACATIFGSLEILAGVYVAEGDAHDLAERLERKSDVTLGRMAEMAETLASELGNE